MLEIGTKAPDFTLPDQDGNMVTLSSLQGQKVVLYFYPRDMTSGCTQKVSGKIPSAFYPCFRYGTDGH